MSNVTAQLFDSVFQTTQHCLVSFQYICDAHNNGVVPRLFKQDLHEGHIMGLLRKQGKCSKYSMQTAYIHNRNVLPEFKARVAREAARNIKRIAFAQGELEASMKLGGIAYCVIKR